MNHRTSEPEFFAQLPDGQLIQNVARPHILYRRRGNLMEEETDGNAYYVHDMKNHFPPDDLWSLVG